VLGLLVYLVKARPRPTIVERLLLLARDMRDEAGSLDVNFYNATSSIVRFENIIILICLRKAVAY
jgi:hypothetical protein